MKEYTVYILKSICDGKRYIGVTTNITRRLSEHESGNVKSTKNRGPLKLIHTENFDSKSDALSREKYYKSGKGREELLGRGL